MNRKLTPCTIVPPELYVIREADKQLQKVLRDMGRPGYILVARQMGKTNLLLNAKRELEDQNNAVIYVDLSAPFESERECFRHIIDTALETGPDVFGKCKKSIYEARKDVPPPSYKEHENELRALLAVIDGKLVIILDEIDSLTKGTFSDKVFAQIRSVYFSRTNYPQFKRLTYILSGVVEPTEIIKDKRISPFNIGEKIYLDDFTFEQFLDFISRAGLDVGEDVFGRIYYWAGGNPRLTWDICYDIEEKLSEGKVLTTRDVDESVKKLYLTDFTRAPIDNIREVVTADDELRNAITVIKCGKGNTLPDTTKNKLYLTGIIRSAANHTDITIKNRIIEAALSDQWLLDITVNKKGLAKIAAEKYDEHKYEEALTLYEQLLRSSDSSAKEFETPYFKMGLCAYYSGQYQKALGYLEKSPFNKTDYALFYYERAFFIGACYLRIGNVEASRAQFQETLQNPTKNISYFTALVNIGITYSTEKNFPRAIELFREALASIDNSSLPPEDGAMVKSSAFYSLAKAYSDKGDATSAQVHYQEALSLSSPQQRPAIMLAMYKGLATVEAKEGLLSQCIDFIISQNLHPDPSQFEVTLGFTTSLLYTILRETYIVSRPLFDRLFTFSSTLEELKTSSAALLLDLAYLSAGNGDYDAAVCMARDVVEKTISGLVVNREAEFQSYRLLSLFCKEGERERHQLKYLECLKSGYEPKAIDSADIEIFTDLAVQFIKSDKPDSALEYLNLVKQYKPLVPQDQMSEFAAVNYFEMVAYRNAGSWTKLREVSEETIAFLKTLNGCSSGSRLITEESLKRIGDYARSNLKSDSKLAMSPFTRMTTGKYGRNDKVSVRYQSGTIKRGVKFKYVDHDLANGRCFIIEEEQSAK